MSKQNGNKARRFDRAFKEEAVRLLQTSGRRQRQIVLQSMQAAGKGVVVSSFGTLVERLLVNLTDPAPELGNARSTRAHPHPFLSDRAVRKALSMAIDRELLVEVGYGQAARPTCNVVPAPEVYASAANEDCLVQDIEGAKRLLDEAGWRPGPDGVRQEDGIRAPLKMPFSRTVGLESG